jgi:glycosyltransferase involved in cell wall biosynthesis
MQRICTSLSKAGYEVLLTGRRLPASVPLREMPFVQKRLHCVFHKGKLFYLEYNIRLFFFLLFQRAAILAPVDADTLVPAFLVSRIRSLKLVFDAHEYFSEVPEVARRKPVQRIWQWVERTFYPRVAVKYTVSETLAAEMGRRYGTSFHTIRNVPLLNAAHFEEPDTDRFILYQGALNEGRALEELIAAMVHLPLRLKLAGEGDLSTSLRAQVKQLKLEEKVEFLGYVPPEELTALTRKAYLGYNLLHHAGESYFYSLSNKFFDYMHAGVPSLNPPFPEYNAILARYSIGVVCEAKASDITECVNRLLRDASFYATLRQQCETARQQYNWQQEEQLLIQLYESC